MTGGEKLVELLERAGLEVVGGWRTEDVLPPQAAWRPILAGESEPYVSLRADRPNVVAEFNAQWHRHAVEHGVIGEDGVFLIDVVRSWTSCMPRLWTRVRLTAQWDFAGVLGERPGEPVFVTLAMDGDTLLATTPADGELRLTVIDRIGERREAAAQTAAQETEAERTRAWESLLQEPLPSERTRESWAHGLVLNPATPEDVRGSLVGLSHHALWLPLPTAVVEAALTHPEWKVRGLLAEAQPNITPEQWGRLILGEQDARHRWILTMLAADRGATLTDTAYEQLTADPSDKVREETARLSGIPTRLAITLAADPSQTVRAAACRNAWPHLDGRTRATLLNDPDSKVRIAALLRHHRDHPMPRAVFDSEGLGDQAAETCRLERDLAEHLIQHGDPAQRCRLAGNHRLDSDVVELLAADPDGNVRSVAATHPALTEEQRAAIDYDFDPRGHCSPLKWVTALHESADAMRRLAASSHPLIRRSVARARHLPPDIVAILANDEDHVVQLFLAESCDDAPADMLLRVWLWWTGSLSTPDRPRGHQNFPRHDLLQYADDPNPRLRQLALDDPESTAELVERFGRDASEEVRRRAAADPRLTTASAVRLLDDAHSRVRHAAAGHPQLPARVLVRLLHDPDTAQAAARHPAVPAPVMEWMFRLLQPLPTTKPAA
ncbi:PE-PGRS family protein [Streptomyces sp. NPDC060028]|uniref:PE-PGRS family protein n=1 Tax=Streptomyces sp. NPDC060028 TaxID=3347041 RepID=UPI0036A6466B